LDQVLKTSNEDGTKLNEETIQYLVYQMVRALKHIHSANVMHRDLKPDNIGVLENDGLIQILDFGLVGIAPF
jgi:serine/threonine protein kinase